MNLHKSSLLLVCLLISNVFALDITSVLNTGQSDFDPWNTERWEAWYSGGVIVEPFDISTDVNFAVKTGDWYPELSTSLADSGKIFGITGQGIVVDGKGLVVDGRPSAYRADTLSTVYNDSDRLGDTIRFKRCFSLGQPLNPSITDSTIIQNFTVKGFSQGMRVSSQHPLIIRNCIFSRNEWGFNFSGLATTVTANQFLENGRGAMYNGAGGGKAFITYNTYRDNGYVPEASYGDIVMDTTYKTSIEHNYFIESQYTPTHFSAAISIYRNMGENNSLRENTPYLNFIRYNSINDRQVGVHMGARMGIDYDFAHDITQESRDYGYYNTIQSNNFNDVTVGIKLNTSGNKIESNTFTNVAKPIVLNCVYYSLTENIINNQNASDVYFWMKYSDYISYAWLFPYQWERNRGIAESEKLVHVRSDYGSDDFTYTGSGTLIVSPTLMVDDNAVVADFDGDKKINFRDYSKLTGYFQDVADINVPVSNGLVVQFDTSDVNTTTRGGVTYVTSWTDQSGYGNNAAQTIDSNQPILVSNATPTGSSAVKFDGGDYLSIVPNSTLDGGNWTIFAVYACDVLESGNGARRVMNLGYSDIDPTATVTPGPTAYSMIVGSSTTGIRAVSRNASNTGIFVASGIPAGYAADTFYVAAATMDSVSTNVNAYLTDATGTVSGTGSGSTSVGQGNTIAFIGCGTAGSTNPAPGNFLNGWLAEVLVYNRVLSSDETAKVNKYLRDKHINPQDSLDPNSYKLNGFIDCTSGECRLDLGSFVSYWLDDISMKDVYSSGGTPIDIAVGDFYEDLPGDEVAVIWSAPVSEISESLFSSTTYYTIIIYDSNGIEINRCGRSIHKWKAIAAGDFLSDTGDEIAAVSEDANNGYYQVSIFRRGYMIPAVTLLPTNTYPIRDITAGNFLTTTDSYDEVAVTYEYGGPMQISYAKPTNVSWSSTTTGLAGRPLQIAGGHFYQTNNDLVAMITENAISGYYKIYFYQPGGSAAFATVQNTNTTPFTAIGGGRFNANLSVDQVAAAGTVVDGVCKIGYYSAYEDGAYQFAGQKAVGVAVAALGCGSLNIPGTLGYYERAEGLDNVQEGYGGIVNGWGKQTAVLPQTSQGHSIPVFWLGNNSSQPHQKYLKVTPIVR